MGRLAVFTDLDGTLLDHDTYQFDQAIPLIRHMRQAGIPVFSVSSKTLAEQQALFDSLDLLDGYVGENGGVVSHRGRVHVLGPSADEIEQARLAIEQQWGQPVPSFKPEHVDSVVKWTGLAKKDALLACQRSCSNPLMVDVDEQQVAKWQEVIDNTRTKLVRGGRFLTLCGHADKAQAMNFLIDQHFASSMDVKTIALGDSANDIPMLQAADYGILMPNSKGSGIDAAVKDQLILAPASGPAGWARAVSGLLVQLGVKVG